MFKKSEEQEWSRFRTALTREREEPTAADRGERETAAAAPPPATGTASAQAPGPISVNPSTRPPAGDVNVTVPGRMGRGDGQEVESLIGEHTHFEGTYRSDGSIRILGSVQGDVESKGSVYIDERARVSAKVTAAQVTIAGRLDGQVYCQGRVEIRSTGRVSGEVQAAALIIQEGAFFDGNSKMTKDPELGEQSVGSA